MGEVVLCFAGASVSFRSCACSMWIDKEEHGGSWDLQFLYIDRQVESIQAIKCWLMLLMQNSLLVFQNYFLSHIRQIKSHSPSHDITKLQFLLQGDCPDHTSPYIISIVRNACARAQISLSSWLYKEKKRDRQGFLLFFPCILVHLFQYFLRLIHKGHNVLFLIPEVDCVLWLQSNLTFTVSLRHKKYRSDQ